MEIAREAFAAPSGVVDYLELNWTRSIEETRSGLHAGLIGAIVADAPDFVFLEKSVAVGAIGFAVRKRTSFRFEGLRSLGMTCSATSAAMHSPARSAPTSKRMPRIGRRSS